MTQPGLKQLSAWLKYQKRLWNGRCNRQSGTYAPCRRMQA